jgi:ACT domain-containing protein
MRISMDLELKDTPGQLVHVLTPISDLGGNIMSVIHHHDEKTFRNTIPVFVVFEMEEKRLDELREKLERSDVAIVRMGKMRLREAVSILLIGHVIHTDLTDTIDHIDRTGYAEVQDLSLAMPEIDGPSSAVITISATGTKELIKAVEILRGAAQKKDLLMIEPLGDRPGAGGQ